MSYRFFLYNLYEIILCAVCRTPEAGRGARAVKTTGRKIWLDRRGGESHLTQLSNRPLLYVVWHKKLDKTEITILLRVSLKIHHLKT